ncbi:MAG TPA: hypothetical protein VHB21_04580 [Minicystis sp.]|nr:hypothetical protein [Minicystis sp.]
MLAWVLPLFGVALAGASCGASSNEHGSSASSASGAGGGHGGGGAGGANQRGSGAGGLGGGDAGKVHYPPNIDPAEAEAMKKLVAAFAKATKEQPVACRYVGTTSVGSPVDATGIPYVVKVAPVDVGPPDGDSRRDSTVLFEATGPIPNPDDGGSLDGSESLIVSYIPSVDPTLTSKNGVYTYRFHGAFTDQLEVKPFASGPAGSRLVFTKLAPDDSVILAITCPGA